MMDGEPRVLPPATLRALREPLVPAVRQVPPFGGPAGVVPLVRDLDHAERACREMLGALGIPTATDGTRETPGRMVRALAEATAGLHTDPAALLDRTFPAEGRDRLIAVPGIRFHSLCEHHCMTFSGTAAVGYVPSEGARVPGLSKIPRMVDGFARRPQMQERLTQQIVDALCGSLQLDGAICHIRSTHLCMTSRGVRAAGAEMVTLAYSGVFAEPLRRIEFLTAAGCGPG